MSCSGRAATKVISAGVEGRAIERIIDRIINRKIIIGRIIIRRIINTKIINRKIINRRIIDRKKGTITT